MKAINNVELNETQIEAIYSQIEYYNYNAKIKPAFAKNYLAKAKALKHEPKAIYELLEEKALYWEFKAKQQKAFKAYYTEKANTLRENLLELVA